MGGCLLLLTLRPSAHAAGASGDLALITQRLRERISQDAPPAPTTVTNWLSAQRPDGSWPDLDYADHSHADWKPLQHLLRLRGLALAYYQTEAPAAPHAAVLASYGRGLAYWLGNAATIYSGNWWYGRIGTQIQLGEALLAMRPALTPAQVQAGSARLEANGGGCGLSDVCTGQNLVWTATAAIYKGCLEDNPAYVTLGFGAIRGTVAVTTADEGLQPDFSFRQHRAQLYSGGYGLGFVRDVAAWMSASQGTAYAFPAATLDLFSSLVLDGDAWMVRGAVFDYSTQGREIARQGVSNKAVQLAAACDRLAALHTAREAEFRVLAAAIRRAGPPLRRGNRHFWRADYMAHQRPAFASSVRLWSTRTAGLENFNHENIQGFYLPQGTNFIYRRGDEYRDIFPAWDWSRLPGVTCAYAAAPPALPAPGKYRFGATDFVGGVSDGTYGLAAFDYRENGVTARKSWFCFDEGVFCLGAGITAAGAGSVITTVNQCRQVGPVTLQARPDAAPSALTAPGPASPQATQTLSAARAWVWHDSVGYFFPAGGPAVASTAAQTGSWKSINDQYGAEPVTQNVFSLWLEHGAAPQGATYQYAVLPGLSATELAAYAAHSPLRVISNTPALQAVHHHTLHLTALAFYEAGAAALPGGRRLSVDKPCLLLVRQQGPRLTLTVANPRATALDVTVNLSAPLRGPAATAAAGGRSGGRVHFALPGGPDGGRSVSKTFTLAGKLL